MADSDDVVRSTNSGEGMAHPTRSETQKTSQSNAGKSGGHEEEKPQKSKIKLLWDKVGLDAGTIIVMFKGSVAPTVAIAMYQSDAVASYFGTIGYLIAVISIISVPMLPRSKFFQTLTLNLVGICIGSSVALLGIWSGVQARIHTTAAGSTSSYNSSQSAVCAIWLFFNIWLVNTMRSKFPQLQFPVIMYSIFTMVAFMYGPLFRTTAQAVSFIVQLLTAFLTAMGLATVVNITVIPITCRTVVFKECAAYLNAMKGVIKSQTAYLKSLETVDRSEDEGDQSDETNTSKAKDKGKGKDEKPHKRSPEAAALIGAITGLAELHGKLHADLTFAKREIAYGNLDADDLEELFQLFRSILIPLIGMGTITDIFERITALKTTVDPLLDDVERWKSDPDKDAKLKEMKLWAAVIKQLGEPFAIASEAMDLALEHVGLLLELIPKPKKGSSKAETGPATDIDVEAKGDSIGPGDIGFAEVFQKKMKVFYSTRGETIKNWARQKGITTKEFDEAAPLPVDATKGTAAEMKHRRDQQQLYLILHMEHLLYTTGTSIGKLLQFAEQKVECGTMKKKKLILPGSHRLRKWITSIHTEDSTVDHDLPDSMETGRDTIFLGQGFKHRKDPEHLPPTTNWERLGNLIRKIPHFLASPESSFGFRVAMATMSIAIIGYLESSQVFFNDQRLVWAMIMIAIGMSPTSGQAISGFVGRVAGTLLAALTGQIIWYIVDGKTPGVIAMLWLFTMFQMYFFVKFPRLVQVFLIAAVTQVLIIGYELQVAKIGIAKSVASGQPYYPTYEFAWYRLACVAGGLFVAFLWTIFPYPLTDSTVLRHTLGGTIYLLANYYSVVHSTIRSRIHPVGGSSNEEHDRELERVRHKIFGKMILMIPSLRQHLEWQKFELTLGGKFPRDTYEAIIQHVSNIMNYLSLMSYASQWNDPDPESEDDPESGAEWMNSMAKLLDKISPTSQAITSTLSLLSASVTQGNALPPYMQMPRPYQLSQRLEQLDEHILDSSHVEEKGYTAFAVIQVCSSLVLDDLKKLSESVKELVGEVDFSFTVVSSASSSSSDVTDGTDKGKRD